MTTSRITGHGVDSRGVCIAYGVANGVPRVCQSWTALYQCWAMTLMRITGSQPKAMQNGRLFNCAR
jgi:hypothetical protein